jgi:arylsulfatase A-like enzyme
MFKILIFFITFACAFSYGSAPRPNILFIWIDDLRNQLGCYGSEQVISPNIDKLASEGRLFNRAYCQQAICTVSRASLITGQRPNKNGVHKLHHNFRKLNPDAVTIMQHLKQVGYTTIGMGKQLHHESDKEWDRYIDIGKELGITKYYDPKANERIEELKEEAKDKGLKGLKLWAYSLWNSYEVSNCEDEQLEDGAMTKAAIKILGELKEQGKPFFLSVGFKKPHLPFVAPKKYWDLYNRDEVKLPENYFFPENMPIHARTDWGELKSYRDIGMNSGDLSQDKIRELNHGYLACITYIDAQIGKLMKSLDQLELSRSTLVVLTSDHGFKIGEHKMHCKHTNFEIDLRVPLIIKDPSIKDKGVKTDSIVELVDLFPTFCDYARAPGAKNLDGISIRPIIKDPEIKLKEFAYSQYPSNAGGKPALGYSIVNDQYRYTEWKNPSNNVDSRMLYDLKKDPQENINIAGNPEYASIIDKLSSQIEPIKNVGPIYEN